MFTCISNYLRLAQIIFILFKNLYSFLPFIPRFLKIQSKYRLGQKLSQSFEELGPIFIKFGQSLSTRADIVGSEVTEDLANLRDRLTPFAFEIASDIIEQEFHQKILELYLEFNPIPIASASIAQVHQAVNLRGEKVAVKVLRPGIEKAFARDIRLFYYLARIVNKFHPRLKRLKLLEVIDTFAATVKMEMDLRLEAAAADELKHNLLNDSSVYIPTIDWQLTSRKVLTLEWIDAISIDNKEELIQEGHNLKDLAAKLSICFFNQAYRDGFFHADLHHGNILVNNQGQLVFIDFGIMGRLDYDTRVYVAEILKGFLERDYLHVAHIHIKAGYVPKHHSIATFAQACRSIGEPIIGLPAKQISVGKLLAQLFKITEDFEMETQPQLLLLQKTLIIVEGVGSSLDQEVNMWQLAEPWIKQWASKNLGFDMRFIQAGKKLINFIDYKLPALLDAKSQNIFIENKINNSGAYIISIITSIIISLLVIYFIK
ncbi:putative ubiquinone biosynthesis protein UbiB [Rickettsiales bacterium Ac37b]|nr:putative ubiquinone biosynthesis protein UbiB [Rickettsiales bacterium Ac37b]